MPSKSKCYLITLGQLSAANAGVQGAHALHALDCKFSDVLGEYFPYFPTVDSSIADYAYAEWNNTSNVLILLNGGPAKQMEEIGTLLSLLDVLAYENFYEDEDTLYGIRTAIAVVLPDVLAEWEPDITIDRAVSFENNEAVPLSDQEKCNMYRIFEGNVHLYHLVRLIYSLDLVR